MAGNWNKLSRAWVKDFFPSSAAHSGDAPAKLQQAIQRTLPLLNEDPTSVPFVCRYRSDVIDPLTTKQVHQLSEYIQKFDSLSSLRDKILDHLLQSSGDNGSTISRVETSISKSELDDIYAPFKPPSKGSLEDRIQKDHPELVVKIDELWKEWDTTDADSKSLWKIKPLDKAATLLANRISADVRVMDSLMEYCERQCRVQVKKAPSTDKDKKTKGSGKKGGKSSSSAFETYHDYTNKCSYLRDHQVLAIRRGVEQKQLKMTFDIDDTHVDRIIQRAAFSKKKNHQLYSDARKDAWSRLLRKRCTSRLWKDVSKRAEEKSIQVFCDNLQKALLAPPASMDGYKAVLAMDPGFQAGIKCAILTHEGKVVSLDTVKFMGANTREGGKKKLASLLDEVNKLSKNSKVLVILGNGHGTREARQLLQDAATDSNIDTNVKLVTEAGASVWSVTEMASEEFPQETPAAVASVSIGRRYLNPLNELVKIPPKSLGLGMYQHDLSEKILDEKLSLTSIDAVAEVGVDVNSCSAAILGKVPSITTKLCSNIMKARPLKKREDLLKVSGLGPKTYQNCAAFVRVTGGKESLDATMVHPESYDLARWLLKKLKWELGDSSSIDGDISNDTHKEAWQAVAKKASKKFQEVSEERALTVIGHLYFSITSPDPRLRQQTNAQDAATSIGSAQDSSALPAEVSSMDKLRDCKLPLRSIIATVRNVVDFGAFVDIGLENDGLLHQSKMKDVSLQSLLVGQEIGVDILGVSNANKISVGLAGLDLPADNRDSKYAKKPPAKKNADSRGGSKGTVIKSGTKKPSAKKQSGGSKRKVSKSDAKKPPAKKQRQRK